MIHVERVGGGGGVKRSTAKGLSLFLHLPISQQWQQERLQRAGVQPLSEKPGDRQREGERAENKEQKTESRRERERQREKEENLLHPPSRRVSQI